MVYGSDEIGVRGSIWDKVFIVGPVNPGGVRLPWATKQHLGFWNS